MAGNVRQGASPGREWHNSVQREAFAVKRTVQEWAALLITATAVAMGIFHIYTAFFGVLTALWQRSIHLTFGMIICFLGI